MATQITIKDVLQKAIQREIESHRLYNDLSEKMTDEAARDAFLELSRQEYEHQQLLEQYLRGDLKGGELKREHVVDFQIAEHLDLPEISPDMELKDTFLVAANREKASHEFYLALAQIHPAGEMKRLLEDLASEELEHKHRVELLYTEVAFPQTDGG